MAGASYTVTVNDKTVYSNCIGHADLENNIPLSTDTVMRLASMTKPITATAVLKAAELGLLSLGDLVESYIPEFSEMTVAEIADGKIIGCHKAKNHIAILDLLNHTSGIGMGTVPTEALDRLTPDDTLATAIPRYASQPLDFEPRTATGYSATMSFDVASRIVELVSGMEYNEFLHKYILDPLGMKDTVYELSEEQKSRLAVMYHCSDGKIVPSRPEQLIFSHVPCSYRFGGARLFSTIEDYTKFARMLAGFGQVDGTRILSENSVRAMAKSTLPDSIRCGASEEWGIGVRVIQKKNENQVLNPGAFGWSGAYETHFFVDPSLGLSAVFFKNVTSGLGSGAITAKEFEAEVMKLFKTE